MSQSEFLAPHQLVHRWGGVVTAGTLANWRSKRVGPNFIKLRGRILYPVQDVQAWEAANKRANDNALVVGGAA